MAIESRLSDDHWEDVFDVTLDWADAIADEPTGTAKAVRSRLREAAEHPDRLDTCLGDAIAYLNHVPDSSMSRELEVLDTLCRLLDQVVD